jgi:hypothetical protein
MMKKTSIFIIFSFLFVGVLSAQTLKESLKKQPKGIIYNTEMSGLLRLHTNGYAIGINYGTLKTYYKTNIWQFEIVHLKDSREHLDRVEFAPMRPGNSASSFVYGKQNSFFGIHAGYGQKYYFSGKAKKQGVAVGMSYAVGPSLGIIKPYYLELYSFDNNGLPKGTIAQSYTEENASLFLNRGSIAGGAGFGYGFDDLSITPGGHAKVALHLDWGAFEEIIRALEVGIMIDVYAKKVPIMIEAENRPYFINLYFSAELGKRK